MHAAGKTNTSAAFTARMAAYERTVDPDGRLDPATRATRAHQLLRADMARLSLRASRSRRRPERPEAA
jgi:hypothetical protein